MKTLFTAAILFLITIAGYSQTFFDRTGDFLIQHVTDGNVDYQAIKSNPNDLNALVEEVKNYDTGNKPPLMIKSFYLNAYNILVIKGIVENYPTKSPLDVEGFFDKKKYNVAGEMITLNDIENKKVRAVYKDARIHFALVCAAKGCPKLSTDAFQPGSVDSQLLYAAQASLNDPYFVRVDKSAEKVEISEIFKWYKEDFGGSSKFLDYINEFRQEKIPDGFAVSHYTYDWSLNEKK